MYRSICHRKALPKRVRGSKNRHSPQARRTPPPDITPTTAGRCAKRAARARAPTEEPPSTPTTGGGSGASLQGRPIQDPLGRGDDGAGGSGRPILKETGRIRSPRTPRPTARRRHRRELPAWPRGQGLDPILALNARTAAGPSPRSLGIGANAASSWRVHRKPAGAKQASSPPHGAGRRRRGEGPPARRKRRAGGWARVRRRRPQDGSNVSANCAAVTAPKNKQDATAAAIATVRRKPPQPPRAGPRGKPATRQQHRSTQRRHPPSAATPSKGRGYGRAPLARTRGNKAQDVEDAHFLFFRRKDRRGANSRKRGPR